MSVTTAISFIRHGMVHNPNRIIYGRLPHFHLSEQGREDAKKAAEALKNSHLQALYCSPLLRTRQTARIILQYHPTLKLHSSRLINEVHTAHEGKAEVSLRKFGGDVYAHGQRKYEQPADILKRSLQFIQRVRKKHKGNHVAAVSHGDVILFLQLWTKRCAITPESKLTLNSSKILAEYPATGSITTFYYSTDRIQEIPGCDYHNTSDIEITME